MVYVIIRGESRNSPDPRKKGGNIGGARGRTPAQQEAVYKKVIAAKRKRAAEVERRRHGTRRKDGEVRHVASIPRELWLAEIQSHGRPDIWAERGKELAKKHGLYFPREGPPRK